MAEVSEQAVLDAVRHLAEKSDDWRNPVYVQEIGPALDPPLAPDDPEVAEVVERLVSEDHLEILSDGRVKLPH